MNYLLLILEVIMQLLISSLREFKLSGMVSTIEERLFYARNNNLSYQELLELLCEDEKNSRRDNNYKKRLIQAKIPSVKRLQDFDFSFQPSIDQKVVSEVASCNFINRAENVILIGGSGTGKTHLATSFGMKALDQGYRVLFKRVSDLIYELHTSRADNSYQKKIKDLLSYDLLILDELGFKQLPKYSAEDLFNIIARRYEQKATIITTNKELDNWNEIFDDVMLTKAIVDRLLHHVVIFNIKGKSYRRKQYKTEVFMT